MKSIKEEFFFDMKKKPFMTFLRKWFSGKEFSDVHVAKCLSSMITHSLVEMDKRSEVVFQALDIPFQVESLSKFVGGGLTNGELRELYRERYFKFIK